ncbi:MAG TPA: HAMP domain-containing sensor histidine kinase [Rubrivivax sp.]|nr:HAMP domain-containing sensor histidine kinase [Rubrivivax sp.]
MSRCARRVAVSALARGVAALLLCALHGAGAAAAAQGADAAPQVLVISGTDPYLPAFVAIDAAMREAVARRHPGAVNWIHESIDTTRFGRAAEPMLAELVARKYENVRIDTVVLATEPTVDFYLRHRQRLWPEAPVVLHFVSPQYAQRLGGGIGLFGLPVQVDYAGAVRLALALQPKARRAVLVGGVSPFDEGQLQGFRDALAPYAERLQIDELAGLPPEQAAQRLAGAAADTVVFYATLFRDRDGRVHVPRAALATLSAASAAPIYGVFDSQLGHGLAAGPVEPFTAYGQRLGELVMRALDTPGPAAARVEPALASACVADARQLQRYALDARQLPDACQLRYLEPGWFERYWWQALLLAAALLAQSLLIAALLWQGRRRRAAELAQQAQRAQLLHASRLAVAGELTASIAHEINQPLGAILSNADAATLLLESGRVERGELLQILADIRRDDQRASDVIQRLRALLARHETERRRFDLNALAETTLALLRAEARRRAVTVEHEPKARRAEVIGDPVQLQQVLINLMLNAFDACAEAPPPQRRVVLGTLDAAGSVQLTVRDFGCGIAPADLPRVFDSFFSTKHSGMGLGLAIARSIVEAHNGTICAERCAPGAQLRIELPLAARA